MQPVGNSVDCLIAHSADCLIAGPGVVCLIPALRNIFVELYHELFHNVIRLLLLFQEGLLYVLCGHLLGKG